MMTEEILGKSKLTARALNSTLIPVVTIIFFGGSLFATLDVDPLMARLWEFWFPTSMDEYVLDAGAIFADISLLGGFIKHWVSDDLIEEYHLSSSDIKALDHSDWKVIKVYFLLFIPAAWYIDYPVTALAIALGLLMFLLQSLFVAIPSWLRTTFTIPQETRDNFIKTKVFALTFVFAVVLTHVVLFGMRAVEYWL